MRWYQPKTRKSEKESRRGGTRCHWWAWPPGRRCRIPVSLQSDPDRQGSPVSGSTAGARHRARWHRCGARARVGFSFQTNGSASHPGDRYGFEGRGKVSCVCLVLLQWVCVWMGSNGQGVICKGGARGVFMSEAPGAQGVIALGHRSLVAARAELDGRIYFFDGRAFLGGREKTADGGLGHAVEYGHVSLRVAFVQEVKDFINR